MSEKNEDHLVNNIFKNIKRNILEHFEIAYNFFDINKYLYFDSAKEFKQF